MTSLWEMIDNLVVINIPAHQGHNVHVQMNPWTFVLRTCQRVLIITYKQDLLQIENKENFKNLDAYRFLLETICGLKSRLVGENEIVNQFKEAYQAFMQQEEKNTDIVRVIEKLFQDAKEIRTKFLANIGQKSYASISRRKFMAAKANKVLILGSGLLAEDMINQLKKKTTVYISGRNLEKVNQLALKHNLVIVPWKSDLAYSSFEHIVNTIGSDEILLGEKFFYDWFEHTPENRLFIDLGSPSSIATSFNQSQNVLRLSDIFEEGAIKEENKLEKIREAFLFIENILEKRKETFQKKGYAFSEANL